MDYTAELAKYAAILEQKGYLNGIEGNASMIDRSTETTYITPSRRMKLLLTPEMVCVMDRSGEQVGGSCRRSSEYLLHEAVYKARPDVGAVIHTHCPYLTAYALRYQEFILPENCSLREIFTRFPCLPYGKPGTHEIHAGIEQALSQSNICLLGGHGVVCASSTMEDCIGLLDAAESFAKTIWLSKQLLTGHSCAYIPADGTSVERL